MSDSPKCWPDWLDNAIRFYALHGPGGDVFEDAPSEEEHDETFYIDVEEIIRELKAALIASHAPKLDVERLCCKIEGLKLKEKKRGTNAEWFSKQGWNRAIDVVLKELTAHLEGGAG